MTAEQISASTDPHLPALSKRRTRTIIFRVTQQEYQQLKTECDTAGVRSLSEYARSALLRSSRKDSVETFFSERLSEIERKLVDLYQSTKEILEFLRERAQRL